MFKTFQTNGLCKPAKFYLYISIAGIIMSIVQNIRDFDDSKYKCGSFSVVVPSVLMIFAFKIVYILFWTYVLNLFCRDNNTRLAWLLVLFPVILFFVILGMLLITGGVEKKSGKEGFSEEDADALMTSDTKLEDDDKKPEDKDKKQKVKTGSEEKE